MHVFKVSEIPGALPRKFAAHVRKNQSTAITSSTDASPQKYMTAWNVYVRVDSSSS